MDLGRTDVGREFHDSRHVFECVSVGAHGDGERDTLSSQSGQHALELLEGALPSNTVVPITDPIDADLEMEPLCRPAENLVPLVVDLGAVRQHRHVSRWMEAQDRRDDSREVGVDRRLAAGQREDPAPER